MSIRSTAEGIVAIFSALALFLGFVYWIHSEDVAAEVRVIARIEASEARLVEVLKEITTDVKSHKAEPAHLGAATNADLAQQIAELRRDMKVFRGELSEVIGILKAISGWDSK